MTNPYAPPPRGRDGTPRPADPPAGPLPPADAPPVDPLPPSDAPPPDPLPEPDPREREPAPHGRRSPTPGTPRPPDPEALRGATRQVLHFALLLLAALATSGLPLPWQVVALLLTVAALVVGVRAMLTVIRLRVRGTLGPALGVGLGLAALLALSLTTALALWPLQVQLQECRRDALTISASQACQAQFEDALLERLGTTPPAGD